MERFQGIANTLFVPLAARIAVSKAFPDYFYDAAAVALEPLLPCGAGRGASQYSDLASVARYWVMDRMAEAFFAAHPACNIVYLGAGLETAFDRLHKKASGRAVNWYAVDLPEVIAARRAVLGERAGETLIGGDLFQMQWADGMETTLPTLLIAAGVFQYFHEAEIVAFLKRCGEKFPQGEVIFDATSESGLRFTNWFIKRTGNGAARMYFSVNDSRAFAAKCGLTLLEERTFFAEALRLLRGRLRLVTKLSMLIAERKKQVLILHLRCGRG